MSETPGTAPRRGPLSTRQVIAETQHVPSGGVRSLLTVPVSDRADVVLLHRRALEIAAALGLGAYRQALLATAVSDPVREAHAGRIALRVTFELDVGPPGNLVVRIGDGAPQEAAGAPDGWRGRCLDTAARATDRIDAIREVDGHVELGFSLRGTDRQALGAELIDALARALAPDGTGDTVAALRERNALLLTSLAQAEAAVASREELLAIVSHDLRNPLGSIVTSAEALEYAGLDGEAADFVGHMSRLLLSSARQMEKLVEDLLDLAGLRSGRLAVRPAPHDALDIVEECVRTHFAAAAAREVNLAGGGTPGLTVPCDRHRVLQVLSNLVGNAIKFSEPGGRVALDVHRDGGRAWFSVLDAGRGMSPTEVDHMFERHWQRDGTDRRGIGLGLSIVRALVEAHDGEIEVESELGAGTCVRVGLPLADAARAVGAR